jgi:hypothetical protein
MFQSLSQPAAIEQVRRHLQGGTSMKAAIAWPIVAIVMLGGVDAKCLSVPLLRLIAVERGEGSFELQLN